MNQFDKSAAYAAGYVAAAAGKSRESNPYNRYHGGGMQQWYRGYDDAVRAFEQAERDDEEDAKRRAAEREAERAAREPIVAIVRDTFENFIGRLEGQSLRAMPPFTRSALLLTIDAARGALKDLESK